MSAIAAIAAISQLVADLVARITAMEKEVTILKAQVEAHDLKLQQPVPPGPPTGV